MKQDSKVARWMLRTWELEVTRPPIPVTEREAIKQAKFDAKCVEETAEVPPEVWDRLKTRAERDEPQPPTP